MKKWYFIAGEDSGDLLASFLINELKILHPDAIFEGMGGDKMEKAGVILTEHVRNTGFMGFWEVLKNLFTIRRLFSSIKQAILRFQPDVVVLVDYPGFNLRMAKWLHLRGIRVFYYISPQLWAWKKGRINIIRKYVEKMYVILPFEKEFYEKEGIHTGYYGHPLMDVKAEFEQNFSSLPIQKQLALLPGSRTQEIRKILPAMLKVTEAMPEYRFVIAGAPSKTLEFYQEFMLGKNVEVRMKQTYSILKSSEAALVASGTATLETALFNVPQVVCYKGSTLSFMIAKRLVKVPFISLVNLICGKEVVKELIQEECTAKHIEEEVRKLLIPENREKVLIDYKILTMLLGEKGVSQKIAAAMSEQLNNTPQIDNAPHNLI